MAVTGSINMSGILYSDIVKKLNAPATAGTEGQVLGLNNNLNPVWMDQSGGAEIDDTAGIGDTDKVVSADKHATDHNTLLNEINDLSNYVTPQMYGAKGDGETDDTTAFESAIATGKPIFVPNGVYVISSKLTIATDMIGEECGKVVIKSSVENEPTIQVNAFATSPSSSAFQNNKVQTLKNILLTRDNQNTFIGIGIAGTGLSIEHCYIYEADYGIVANGSGLYYSKISDCIIINTSNQGEAGVYLGKYGSNMSANCNVIINTVINGYFKNNLKIEGNGNTVLGGDYSGKDVTIADHATFYINGIGNKVVGGYAELLKKYVVYYGDNGYDNLIDIYVSQSIMSSVEISNTPNGTNNNTVRLRSSGGNYIRMLEPIPSKDLFDLKGELCDPSATVKGFKNTDTGDNNIAWYYYGLGTSIDDGNVVSLTGDYYRGKPVYRLTATSATPNVMVIVLTCNHYESCTFRVRTWVKNASHALIVGGGSGVGGSAAKTGMPNKWQMLDSLYKVTKDNNFTFSVFNRSSAGGVQQNDYVDFILPEIYIVSSENGSLLPSGYEQKEWIGMTGTQYIETSYVPQNYDEIETKFYVEEYASTSRAMFSAGTGTYKLMTLLNTSTKNGFYYKYFATGSAKVISGINAQTWYTLSIDKDGKAYVDGNFVVQSEYQAAIDGQNNALWLFRDRNTSGNPIGMHKGKIGRFTVSRSGETKLDMVPCVRTSDDTVGMYDIVSGTFYTNSGTGDFTVPT